MSTEKREFTHGKKCEFGTYHPNTIFHGDDAICQVSNIPINCTLEEIQGESRWQPGLNMAVRIKDCLNACTGLADPQAALDAAREALENAETALRVYDQRVDAKLCADALKLLNPKASD